MKVVIPSAGLGTRFLPATKSQPKEMLPVVDRPIIQYVVEEAAASGADDILIVTGRGKRSLEDHFDYSPEYDQATDNTGMQELSELIRRVRVHFVRQREARGLADAVSLARHHTGQEAFGVLLGDTINVCDPPLLRQLWDHHARLKAPVIAVEPVARDEVRDYGIVEGTEVESGLFRCDRLIEKPDPDQTGSRLGITGSYVLTADIYPAIDQTEPGYHGEIQLTDSLQLLARRLPVYAATFSGVRYDIGNRYLWLKTNLEFAYRSPEYHGRLEKLMRQMLQDVPRS
jgi:UTP--glucose-1-phosphate uridylyltransferase